MNPVVLSLLTSFAYEMLTQPRSREPYAKRKERKCSARAKRSKASRKRNR